MCKKMIYLVTCVFVVTIVTSSICIADDMNLDTTKAHNPYPADGAVVVIWEVVLHWEPGIHAVSHDVYFGEDEEAVKNADRSSPEYKGSNDIGSESYKPGGLDFNTTYYWRVDEINENDVNSPWFGDVWSFGLTNHRIIDDFEDGNDLDLHQSWVDGNGYGTLGNPNHILGNGTGSEIGIDSENFHGGSQSMWFHYDNSGANGQSLYSVVSRPCDPPLDLSEATTFALMILGNANNAPEPMFFVFKDVNGNTVESYHPDPAATQNEVWTEWIIPLNELTYQSVDIENVNEISIVIGDVNDPEPGGSGTMNFDDLRILSESNGSTILNSIGIPPEDCPLVILLSVNNSVPPSWIGEWGIPDPPQDMSGLYNCRIEMNQQATDRIFGETFPPGEEPLVIGPSSDLIQSTYNISHFVQSEQPPAGRYVLLIVQFEGEIPLNDQTNFYQYAFVFDADGISSNNYEPWPDFPNDFFAYTDKWYELSYVPGFGWEFFVTDVRQDFAPVESNARFVIDGSEMAIFIPLDEFDIDTPTFRATAFSHTGDFGMFGGPWSGDLHPLVGEPLLPIASVDSVIEINE